MRILRASALLLLVAFSGVAAAEIATAQYCSGLPELLFICQNLGVDTGLDELARLSGQPTGEVALVSLARAARAKGLHAAEMKIAVDDLADLRVPAMAQTWDDYLVVVESAGSGTLKITQAGLGPQVLSREDFGKIYSGVALLICRDEKLLPPIEAEGPDVRFARYTFDFGRADEGTEVVHAFEFANAGNADLTIAEIHTSCGCTSAFVSANTVPRDASGAVVATFDTSGRLGLQNQEVYVTTNDHVTPVVQLTIGGVVMPAKVLVSPRSVEFHTIRKGQSATREVYLFDPGHTDLEVTDAVSHSPFITTMVEPIRTEGEFSRYRVRIELSTDVPIGELKTKVTIHTNHPKEPEVEIPVSATMKGAVGLHPGLLFLGIVKEGEEGRGSIMVSSVSEQPVKIERIDNPLNHVSVKVTPQVQGKEYLITAILRDTAPAGTIEGEIVVHTSDPDEPQLRVPVHGLVED